MGNELKQVVTKHTRGDAVLDRISSNILPMWIDYIVILFIGCSDHQCISLVPKHCKLNTIKSEH